MAGSLKVKIGIAGFAVIILLGIPLLENSFFAPVTIKRWAKLSWDDFQGIPQPFSSYEAAIASAIYLEYDSTRERFHAYAGQHNVGSWAKRSRPSQDYELNHEQCHFNITELHARKLNEYIGENPDGTEYLFSLRRNSINIDLRKMQREYDSETDHSLNLDKQCRWEYKIDSLLVLDSGWVTDKFSGATVFLPSKYRLSKGTTDGKNRYREYSANKYGLSFSLISFQNESYDDSTIYRILGNYRKGQDTVKSATIARTDVLSKASLVVKDSSNHTSYFIWVHNKSYVYCVGAKYSNGTGDTTGYFQIATSYLNSFSVINTDSIWISEFERSMAPITYSSASKMDGSPSKGARYCMSIEKEAQRPGFYRGPIFRDDGAILVPFDNLIDPDSLHYSDVLLIDNGLYSFDPTSEGQIYFIPADKVPKSPYRIDFGYTLKKDSLKKCYQFYHHTLQMTPQIQPTFAENGL